MRLKQRETMQVQSVRTIQFWPIRISHSEAKRDLCVKNGHIRQSGLVFSARRQACGSISIWIKILQSLIS